MKKRYTIGTLILLMGFASFTGFAQNIQVSVGSATSCPGDIVIPINISNMAGVAAISLKLDFNKNVLTYNGYQSLHSAVSGGGMLVINENNGTFVLSWVNMAGASITNDVLVELLFTTNGGYSYLNWNTGSGNCEFTDTANNILPASYTNGSVNSAGSSPVITVEPVSFHAYEGISKDVSFSANYITSLQWQGSTDSGSVWSDLANGAEYSNVNGSTLTIVNPVQSMNGYKYRCVCYGSCTPSDTTVPVTMTVLPKVIVTAHNNVSCAGAITVPVSVQKFSNIGAFSLTLDFDSSSISYVGFEGLHAQINPNDFIINVYTNQIFMAWASVNSPLTITDNDTLIRIKLFTDGNNTSLTWHTPGNYCEVTNAGGTPLYGVYNNASISSSGLPPAFYQQNYALNLTETQNGDFYAYAYNTASYQWQVSMTGGAYWTDVVNDTTYSGAQSGNLHLNNVSVGMDGFLFRCIAYNVCPPPDTSATATLNVDPAPQVITTTIETKGYCNKNFSVPILVQDFNGVSSVSLVISYDTAVLTYNGISNEHAEIQGGITVVNVYDNKIWFSWASVTPANIGDGNLFSLDFSSNGGTTQLSWVTQPSGYCEYSDTNANLILGQFINGTLTIDTNTNYVSFSGLAPAYCENDPEVQLTGTPSGGTFSGNGISGSQFIPQLAGPGYHIISYTIINYLGCHISDIQSVNVLSVFDSVFYDTISDGETYHWMGNEYISTGVYDIIYSAQNGCDSIYTLNLTVNRVSRLKAKIEEPVCDGTSVELIATGIVPGGQGSNTSGVLALNGINQYVSLDSLTDLSGEEMTIEYWFKGTNIQSAVRQQSVPGEYIVAGWSDPPKHILSFDGSTGGGIMVDATGNSVIYNGGWHHVALTWKKNLTNGFVSYLDGVLQQERNSANVDIPNINYPVIIGSVWGSSEFTNGNIDNVRIWSVAHSQSQIQNNMYNETPFDTTGLIAHYKFNGDFTCDNHITYNGTAYNNPTFAAPDYYTFTWSGPDAPPSGSTNEVQYTLPVTTSGDYYVTASIAGGISQTSDTISVIAYPSYFYEVFDTVCFGDPYMWHGNNYTTSGIYYDSLVTSSGCDSIYVLNLYVRAGSSVSISASAGSFCNGDSVTLTADIVFGGENCGLSSNLLDGLVAYYPFDGNANDESGSGNNGTVYGASLTQDRFGNENSAYSFDGSDYIKAPADNLPAAERTISLWFKVNSLSNNPALLGYGGNSCGESWFEALNSSAYYMSGHCGANTIMVGYSQPDEPVNTWKHMVVSTSSSGTKIYIDGVLENSNSNYINNTYVAGKFLGIGVVADLYGNVPYTDPNVGYFNGDIDDVLIYNRELLPSEVTELFEIEQRVDVLWSTGDTAQSITVTSGGTYSVMTSNNGCIDYDTILINEYPNYEFVSYDSISMGDTLIWHGNTYTTAGIYYDSLQTIHGCDSVFVLNLFAEVSFTISGKTRYAAKANVGNPAPNPPTYNASVYNIGKVTVILKSYPGGVELARDTSDAQGNYQFTGLTDGDYKLSYDKYTLDTMQWGNGIDAIDVTLLKYYIGIDTLVDPSRCFSSKYKKAANVDNNLLINAIDISRLKAKIGAPYNTTKNFPKGNWVALDKLVSISGSDVMLNLETICYGDYNASSIKYRDSLVNWNTGKSIEKNIISLADDYVTTSDPAYFEIPLRISSAVDDFSAMGLELGYPSKDYKLASVSMPHAGKNQMVKINPTLEEIIAGDDDLLVTDENGVIRVVYATTRHFDVAAGDEVIRLGFRPVKDMPQGILDFELSGTGVVGDQYGEEQEDAYLIMPKILVQGNSIEAGFDFSGYPNPFNGNATLIYDIPENGMVKLSVYNTIGEQVCVLVNESQAVGKHTAAYALGELARGMYTFKLEFTGAEASKCLILKMIH